jgi:hypothetical protein
MYKAAELVNALVQIRENKLAAGRVGPEKAAASRKLAREAFRNRCIDLFNGESVSLEDT